MKRYFRTTISIMKSFAIVAVLLLLPLHSWGMAGTDIVATRGHSMQPIERLKWSEAVWELVNDPARSVGWHPWFSELPNDTYLFAYEVGELDEINRVIKKFAAIKHERARIMVYADDRFTGAGLVGDRVKKQIERGEFGVHTRTETPKAHPPTLILYAGHPEIDLDTITIPQGLKVTAALRDDSIEKRPETVAEMKRFFDRHRLPWPQANPEV